MLDSEDDLGDAIAAAKLETLRLHSFAMGLQGELSGRWAELMDRIELVQERLGVLENQSVISSFPAVRAALVTRGVTTEGAALADQISALQRQVRRLSNRVYYGRDSH